MDSSLQRLLSDKLYDKRKAGALELEAIIRNCLAEGNNDTISKIVHQLCNDYAYAVHQPHARNGGLIGLAAAAIALGPQVARYLKEIVPPVLACFSDQDARVRYYACESMYNISKVAKGEILVYFNDIFDALCKLAADTENSVKNGAELLDRLVKDIVSESAATYASEYAPKSVADEAHESSPDRSGDTSIAFSLKRFIPLLEERINVLNPFVRTFLVSWIVLLDSVPDLELVAFLPSFLGGLLRFLSDANQDVHTTTKSALDRFLSEILKIAAIKKGLAESKKSRENLRKSSNESVERTSDYFDRESNNNPQPSDDFESSTTNPVQLPTSDTQEDEESSTVAGDDEEDTEKDDDPSEDEWIPGQDVQIDYQEILDILVTFLSDSREEEVQVTTLRWIRSFMDICPEEIIPFTPRLLAQVLPLLSHHIGHVNQAANLLNQALMAYILSLPEELTRTKNNPEESQSSPTQPSNQTTTTSSTPSAKASKDTLERQANGSLLSKVSSRKATSPEPPAVMSKSLELKSLEPRLAAFIPGLESIPQVDLDYEAAVNALTMQFFHEHEATRVAALAWLIMLHRKSPRKILAIQDSTFPALLRTLSDPAESVVTRDLLLLSQISKSSDDSYFSSFMVNLLKLFGNDRRLLETRGNLIIRQLCLTLSAEKIYRTMADCLERDEYDIEFASIMVQNLNNNLITAPELADLRKRLRNLESRDGQVFFTVLFRAWCVNAVATFSLCLLAQAYEQAYNLLQIFADLEMTVNMLIQIDKLVQLLESPVFTYLRMQLLEPERFPHLYKCLYGLLMLLPQSSAFAALKNRLNSVSAIGYLHIVPRGAPVTPSSISTFERQNRLKSREEGGVRWGELLEKFRNTQERVRRAQNRQLGLESDEDGNDSLPEKQQRALVAAAPSAPSRGGNNVGNANSRTDLVQSGGRSNPQQAPSSIPSHMRARSGLGHLRGLAKVGKKDKDKDKK